MATKFNIDKDFDYINEEKEVFTISQTENKDHKTHTITIKHYDEDGKQSNYVSMEIDLNEFLEFINETEKKL